MATSTLCRHFPFDVKVTEGIPGFKFKHVPVGGYAPYTILIPALSSDNRPGTGSSTLTGILNRPRDRKLNGITPPLTPDDINNSIYADWVKEHSDDINAESTKIIYSVDGLDFNLVARIMVGPPPLGPDPKMGFTFDLLPGERKTLPVQVFSAGGRFDFDLVWSIG